MLTKHKQLVIIIDGGCEKHTLDAAVAQSVERRIGSAEVTGPIPVSSSDAVEIKAFQGNYSLKCLYFYWIIEDYLTIELFVTVNGLNNNNFCIRCESDMMKQ